MNIKNLEFLKESLKYLGFGERMNNDLENKIREQPAQFQLSMTGEFGRDTAKEKVDYVLDFKKSDQTDMYFFNKYQATLKNDDPEKARSQTFYISGKSGVTAKEAYNLLNGRAVNKGLMNAEEQKYNAWLQLDFSEKDKNNNHKVNQYHEGYGFDLNAVLMKYPIKELSNDDQKKDLMKSLEKGNVQQVTFTMEGKDQKMYVEANPRYKTLNVYDVNMKKQFQSVDKKEEKGAEKSQEKKEAISKSPDDEGEPKEKKQRRRVGI